MEKAQRSVFKTMLKKPRRYPNAVVYEKAVLNVRNFFAVRIVTSKFFDQLSIMLWSLNVHFMSRFLSYTVLLRSGFTRMYPHSCTTKFLKVL